MTLDNGKKIVLLRLIGFISTLVYVLYIFLAYFERVFRHSMSESAVNIMTAVITVVYLVSLFWPALMKYRYIYFSSDERNITLRWYKTGLMPGRAAASRSPPINLPVMRSLRKRWGFIITLLFSRRCRERRRLTIRSASRLFRRSREPVLLKLLIIINQPFSPYRIKHE